MKISIKTNNFFKLTSFVLFATSLIVMIVEHIIMIVEHIIICLGFMFIGLITMGGFEFEAEFEDSKEEL